MYAYQTEICTKHTLPVQIGSAVLAVPHGVVCSSTLHNIIWLEVGRIGGGRRRRREGSRKVEVA